MCFRVLCAWHKEEQIYRERYLFIFLFLVIINSGYGLYIAQTFDMTFIITVFRNTLLTPTLTIFLE